MVGICLLSAAVLMSLDIPRQTRAEREGDGGAKHLFPAAHFFELNEPGLGDALTGLEQSNRNVHRGGRLSRTTFFVSHHDDMRRAL